MSRTIADIRRHIQSAEGLKSVVKTMKTLAMVSIGPYERAMPFLDEYETSVETGFRALLWNADAAVLERLCEPAPGPTGAIVFGTDHGMAADFNETLASFVAKTLRSHADGCHIWPVGELLAGRLEGSGLPMSAPVKAPESVDGIPGLLSCLLYDVDRRRAREGLGRIVVFHQVPIWGAGCEPASSALLPLDRAWLDGIVARAWPSRRLPEPIDAFLPTVEALLREHLFASLFRACVSSAAAEHAVRLASMQRAERNINDLLDALGREYNEQRQTLISEELFDVIAGFEVLKTSDRPC
ncbi:MAG TPA: F0F1 ATP synthase subunit gamma [Candidatus Ozemobacteraceae bacterium]|nr:F0F1 ATP synthase subunit gamma [Candidatus Ozemobacteraceae bacterium]